MEDLWTLFCGQTNCSTITTTLCDSAFKSITDPSSCVNHAAIISLDILLLILLLIIVIYKRSSKRFELPARYRRLSTLQIISAIYNGCLGLVYIGLGIWTLVANLRNNPSAASPIHWWCLYIFQGFTWFLVGLTASLKGQYYFRRFPFQIMSIFAFLSAAIFGCVSLSAIIVHHERTVKVALDVLLLLGASFLLLCTYKGFRIEEITENNNGSTLYTPLKDETNGSYKKDSLAQVSLFGKAGLFSTLTFWWLNPLMKFGKQKTLEEEDIPKLRDTERAEFCYQQFMDQFNNLEKAKPSSQPSLLRTLVACHRKELLLSGFFAFLKIVTLSAGPLLLNAFIEVAEGKEAFRYEGYVLAVSLFISKNLESLSQRHWYFRSRLIGLKVRSFLTAAIYRKQLRLSNASRLKHSAGEIMNYVTVDAYRIGEFPFWLHQTWTTSLQLCFALIILVHSVGLATLAALAVIVLTVLCNTPLAKLQHKFQSKLMVAQDVRLKACSEALVNTKVLKLYA